MSAFFETQNLKLKQKLRGLEWRGNRTAYRNAPTCPDCGHAMPGSLEYPQGHAKDCELIRLLEGE